MEQNWWQKWGEIKRGMLLLLSMTLIACGSTVWAQESTDQINLLKQEIQDIKNQQNAKLLELEQKLMDLQSQNEQIKSTSEETQETIKSLDALKGVEFHGYGRAGAGVNSEGGDQEVFMAPGAGAKYRLGNEVDTWLEMDLAKNWTNPDSDGAFFKSYFKITYQDETHANTGYDDTDHVKVSEAYVETGNVLKAFPEVKFWAGKRWYRRDWIHINDFFFLNSTGNGGGVEDIDLGFGKLAVAFMQGTDGGYQIEEVGRVSKNMFDIRFDFSAPVGDCTIWVAPSWVEGGNYLDTNNVAQEYPDADGYAVGMVYSLNEILGGSNKFSIQYGEGTGSDFTPNVQSPTPTLDNSSQFLITDQFTIQPCEKFSMQTALVYRIMDDGTDQDSQTDWFSFGLRPTWHFSKYLSACVEAGMDYVDSESNGYNGMLYKVTPCLQISAGDFFFARPSVRLFATYADWADDFKGLVGGDAFINETDGYTCGVQMEVWW
ncbi:MAG: carbohydrate porin [Desulfobacterales bacterium]|nr:carbohydrate porin [Desulfobacterales bacterium]MDD4072444.1 carbohydrate porin [Desulfobacterales bacterium]MDD4392726.1 carbohydrate porin [Desulfobacterales bacterium]